MEESGLAGYGIGERVKVKGTMEEDGVFRALEMVRREGKPNASLQGRLESVSPAARRVCVLGRDFELPEDVVVKDLMGDRTALESLQVGETVKVKGPVGNGGMRVKRIKSKESLGFDLDEIQGCIEVIEPEASRFEVAGFEIRVSADTAFRG